MNRIVLQTADWTSREDLFDALLPALGAPAWHGRNLDALWDTLCSDDINRLRLPMEIILTGKPESSELRRYLSRLLELNQDARKEGMELTIRLDAMED